MKIDIVDVLKPKFITFVEQNLRKQKKNSKQNFPTKVEIYY